MSVYKNNSNLTQEEKDKRFNNFSEQDHYFIIQKIF